MAFFSREKLKPKKILVERSGVSSNSPEVQKRLSRIENNYQELDAILAELELKMANDDRLRAINEFDAEEFEATFGVKRKRKWRPDKPKSKRASVNRRRIMSADPKKPR
ncbi:MAG: hypothetical protein P8J27_15975 [Mariniblastus sp.]|nr:hypothetical protein [Mariniblastus sp.]